VVCRADYTAMHRVLDFLTAECCAGLAPPGDTDAA